MAFWLADIITLTILSGALKQSIIMLATTIRHHIILILKYMDVAS